MIELQDVHKAFGDNEVLRGVDLTVPTGRAWSSSAAPAPANP